MKLDDLRPDDLREEVRRLYLADLAWLMERRHEFVPSPCPACDQPDGIPAFDKNGFTFRRCRTCATMYVSPRPPLPLLMAFFAQASASRFWHEQVLPRTEAARREKIFVPRARRVAELCREHGAPTATLADVGAGSGIFCDEMGRLGVFGEVIAIEPESGHADACRARGLTTIEKPIEAVELTSMSVITSFELIEHLGSPQAFLHACHRALAPEGLLILTTPNMQGFDLLTLGQHSDNVNAPQHLNYFNTPALVDLLQRCGFAVRETLTPGKLDAELVRRKVLSGEFSLDGQPFLQQVLIDDWERVGDSFQQFLADNGLSSHLWIVAQRR